MTVFLKTNYSVWCVPDERHGLSCLLPKGPALPFESLVAEAFGPVDLVSNCDDPPVDGAQAIGLRQFYAQASPAMYGVAARAVPIAEWHRTTRFCGVCGVQMTRDACERAKVCPVCAFRAYPRINPVVIVRITRGDELLLARRAVVANTFFSVIAGFVEAGESLEECLAREVLEEVNITVRNIRYFHSQPWSFPNNLMVAFTAEHAAGEVRPDGVELAEAGWFRRGALPPLPGPISIARRMIDAWASEHPPRPRE